VTQVRTLERERERERKRERHTHTKICHSNAVQVQMLKYPSAFKRKGILTHATMWTRLKDTYAK
jgi:hypothetical protein